MAREFSQNEIFVANKFLKEKKYWTDKLSEEVVFSRIPFSYDDLNASEEIQYNSVKFTFNEKICSGLIKLSNGSDYRLHMILIVALKIMLNKYSGNDDIIVGTKIYKQDKKGEFINSLLLLRSKVSPNMSFKELLIHVKNDLNHSVENQNYPIRKLVYELETISNKEGVLFDTMVLLENIQDRIVSDEVNPNTIFRFVRKGNSVAGTIDYNACRYIKTNIEKLIEHLSMLLEQVIYDVDITLDNIDILTQDEKDEFVNGFNNTRCDYEHKTIHQLFENIIEEKPDAIALVFDNRTMTYRELNDKSNQLARMLRSKCVKNNTIVGIIANNSFELIVAIWAVIKAGGAYLPIDPSYPEDRIIYMLEDSNAQILLGQNHFINKLNINIDFIDINDESIYIGDKTNLENVNTPEDLIYVIYTSGSTGRPKGAMINHKGLLNYVLWAIKEYLSEESIDFSLFSSISFDLTVTSIYTPLLSGNKIFIYENNEFVIKDILRENKVDIIKLTPAHLEMIKYLDNIKSDIKKIIVGGEQLKASLAKEIFERFDGQVVIYNEYGPTETVVGCMTYKYDPVKDTKVVVPIGRPIDNMEIYLLDKYYKTVPKNVIGDIYVSGLGVFNGYMNLDNITNEKLIENVFHKGLLMYKTGDQGKRLDDGNIEFIGRSDNQVKIKGFRIEIEEIEKVILEHEHVKETVVMVKKDGNGNKFLCAYLIQEKEISYEELRQYMIDKLPEYMIPLFFISVDNIPLTINGKKDYEKLSNIKSNKDTDKEQETLNNDVEIMIASIWSEVLGIDKVGKNDEFFKIGGDSIKAILISSKLQKYGFNTNPNDIFKYQTIKELAQNINCECVIVDQEPIVGNIELTPIQKYFFEQKYIDQHHWNQSVIIYKEEGFNEEAIKVAFDSIVKHHDALRIVFSRESTQFNRTIDEALYNLSIFDFTKTKEYKESILENSNFVQQSIDLEKGPLVKLALYKTIEGDHLLIVIHHLVIDGVSWRILLEDLAAAYTQALNNKSIELQLKTNSYKDWAQELKAYSESSQVLNDIEYWNSIEIQNNKIILKDDKNKLRKMVDMNVKYMELSIEDTEKLLKDVNRAYNTQINDILLTALALAVNEWIGEQHVLINLEGHGREPLFDKINISRTIGWFTIQYPIILNIINHDNISHLIKETKETLRHIPNKGISYGILRYLTPPHLLNGLKFKLKPKISFNYLGRFDEDIKKDVFNISELPAGKNYSDNSQCDYAIEIIGMIINNKLGISFSYSKTEFNAESIDNLVELYNKNLKIIISHCIGKSQIELTPTDYGDSKLTLEELDDILVELDL